MTETDSSGRQFKLTWSAPPEPSPGGLAGIRKTLKAFFRGSTPNHLHLRQRLVFLWGLSFVADIVFSVIAYLLESDKPGSDLHNYGDALFWTSTQLLTVSSSLANPVTGWGQVLDVLMELIGITLISALAGSLGSFLYRHSMERNPMHHILEGVAETKPATSGSPDASSPDHEAGT